MLGPTMLRLFAWAFSMLFAVKLGVRKADVSSVSPTFLRATILTALDSLGDTLNQSFHFTVQ